ncbi:replication initiation protein RepC [Nitrobacter vulgaris]|uniref:replication initiation protein RepC n=1 Tax=Nitrobacter vulgaris TaxID=29421 RepID=UPI001FCCD74B|nr:replication initiation protein RepC [Nitrobacter vulgaris]
MGEGPASRALAAILQRGTAIKSLGGYLRILARRAATWRVLGLADADGATPARARSPRPKTVPALPSRTMFRRVIRLSALRIAAPQIPFVQSRP